MDKYNAEYYDKKWKGIIPFMPIGGQYRYDLRKYSYDVIVRYIKKEAKVYDFAAGLSVIGQMLQDRDCEVSGCDISPIAIEWNHSHVSKDFRVSDEIHGKGYDFILAMHFLEHITEPVEWVKNARKKGKKIIAVLPNNCNHIGEHVNMQWDTLAQFEELYADMKITRLDTGKYREYVHRAYQNPIYVIS